MFCCATGEIVFVRNMYYEKHKASLNGNILAQIWNITHLFNPSYFKHVVNSTINRTFLGLCYKNKQVKGCTRIWPTLIVFQQLANHWLLYLIKIRTNYAKKERFCSFNHILLGFSILSAIYNALKSVNCQWMQQYASMNQTHCKPHLLYISHVGK